ncbi:MAG: hypothetical protein ACTSPB_03230 [Candidatus Thorarchaeota archaeon]
MTEELEEIKKILETFPVGYEMSVRRGKSQTRGKLKAKLFFSKSVPKEELESNHKDIASGYSVLNENGGKSNVTLDLESRAVVVEAEGEWDDLLLVANYDIRSLLMYDYASELGEIMEEVTASLQGISIEEGKHEWDENDVLTDVDFNFGGNKDDGTNDDLQKEKW